MAVVARRSVLAGLSLELQLVCFWSLRFAQTTIAHSFDWTASRMFGDKQARSLAGYDWDCFESSVGGVAA